MTREIAHNNQFNLHIPCKTRSHLPSTAALFLSLAFASSRSIDLFSRKVSSASKQSEADPRDGTYCSRQCNNGLQGSVLNRQSSIGILAPARGPDGHGVLRNCCRLASELRALAAGCHRGAAAVMVTGAATTSCFLFIFEAEALCCGRLSLVVLGHGEVCFVTSSDGRGHEKGEKKKEKGEECKSYCCRPTGTLQKSSEGFILQRIKSRLLLISQGEGSGQEADGVIIGQQRTSN